MMVEEPAVGEVTTMSVSYMAMEVGVDMAVEVEVAEVVNRRRLEGFAQKIADYPCSVRRWRACI
jgi:hypothetical protein